MKIFTRIFAGVLALITGASAGAATVFSYAGYTAHNTDPGLTAIVWGVTMLYAGITVVYSRDIRR